METELPILETVCSLCKGERGTRDESADDGWVDCYQCEGAGFIPTESGRRILALMRHNVRVKIASELEITSA